jgi:hypothetical protein
MMKYLIILEKIKSLDQTILHGYYRRLKDGLKRGLKGENFE